MAAKLEQMLSCRLMDRDAARTLRGEEDVAGFEIVLRKFFQRLYSFSRDVNSLKTAADLALACTNRIFYH